MPDTIITIGSAGFDILHVGLLALFLIALLLAVWLWTQRQRADRYSSQLKKLQDDMGLQSTRFHEQERDLAASKARQEAMAESLERERSEQTRRVESLEAEKRTLHMRLEESNRELDSLKICESERSRAMDEERKQLRELRKEVEDRFTEIAQAALKQSQSLFLETANETFGKQKEAAEGNLKALVSPIREAIGKFETRVEGMEKVRNEDKSAIFEQVKNIGSMLNDNRNVTAKLVMALSSPKGGGRWGEESLKNVMEMAGLSEHADFTEQVGNAGDGLRPDVIIRMPGGREVVVDSKVSIQDFLNAAEETDESRRDMFLAAHARKLRDHVKRLASKEYWKSFESRVDFVAMYVPGENFYAAAVQVDRELFDFAARNKVLIVTPSTLIALAKAVSYGWRQEEATRNAREAADLGRELYKRLATMSEHVANMGTSLRGTVKNYDRMTASLESRVLSQARRFEDLHLADPGGKMIPNLELINGHEHGLDGDLLNAEETETAENDTPET